MIDDDRQRPDGPTHNLGPLATEIFRLFRRLAGASGGRDPGELAELAEQVATAFLNETALDEDHPEACKRAAVAIVDAMVEQWSAEGFSRTVRNPPTPGRNEACPCGSGDKYKRCCGARR